MSSRTTTLILLCLVVIARAGDPPATLPAQHLDITLRKTRWQPLPQAVHRVYVGPDDRVWYELDAPAASDDPAVFKAMVEREFRREAPQLYGAMPILFEPKGRVWFCGRGALQRAIFGYDGKTWIQRPLQANHALHGTVPNRRPRPGYANLFVGDVAFFIETFGVEQYDGKDWSYCAFYTHPPKQFMRPLIEVEPDGKGVVALINDDEPQLWRWRDGKWTEAAAPGPLGRLWRFAPVEGGVVTLTLDGDLRFRPYDPNAPDAFTTIVKQLDHEDPAVRDQAANSLAAMGQSAIPAVEKLLAAAQSPEAITRLQKILVDLKTGKRPPYGVLGAYRAKKIHMLEYLADRTLCLAAGAVADAQGNDLGAGVILQPPQGEPRFLPGEALAKAFDFGTSDLSSPALAGNSRLWLPPVTSGASAAATLVDLKEGKILATLPDPRCRFLHAARADGTCFASPDLRSNIMVFIPGAEDQRNFLARQERAVAPRTIGIATDGSIYAITGPEGLARFDGKTWTPMDVFQREAALNGALAGADGVMLFRADRSAALIAGGKITTAPNVQTLITENRDAVTKAFAAAPNIRGNYQNPLEAVVVDSAKNIWVLDNGRLIVLAGDRWLDAQLALKAAGSPAGFIHFLAPVGDASKVYVTDFSGSGRGISALGQVRNGAVVFTPADRTDDREPTFLTVRDPAGALWLPITWRVKPTDGQLGGRWATRITEKGIDIQLKDAGWPALCDLDGNVWLAQGRAIYNRVDRFALYRDGKIVHTLDVTGAGQHPRLHADRKGSVWAWTDIGLQHFLAPDRAKPWLYQLDKIYTPRDLTRSAPRAEFSSLGYLVLITTPAQQHLYLVKLPDGP